MALFQVTIQSGPEMKNQQRQVEAETPNQVRMVVAASMAEAGVTDYVVAGIEALFF